MAPHVRVLDFDGNISWQSSQYFPFYEIRRATRRMASLADLYESSAGFDPTWHDPEHSVRELLLWAIKETEILRSALGAAAVSLGVQYPTSRPARQSSPDHQAETQSAQQTEVPAGAQT